MRTGSVVAASAKIARGVIPCRVGGETETWSFCGRDCPTLPLTDAVEYVVIGRGVLSKCRDGLIVMTCAIGIVVSSYRYGLFAHACRRGTG